MKRYLNSEEVRADINKIKEEKKIRKKAIIILGLFILLAGFGSILEDGLESISLIILLLGVLALLYAVYYNSKLGKQNRIKLLEKIFNEFQLKEKGIKNENPVVKKSNTAILVLSGLAIISLVLMFTGSRYEEIPLSYDEYILELSNRVVADCDSDEIRRQIDEYTSVSRRLVDKQCSNMVTNRDLALCEAAGDELEADLIEANKRFEEPCNDARDALEQGQNTFEEVSVLMDGEQVIIVEELSDDITPLQSFGFVGLNISIILIVNHIKKERLIKSIRP